jgi:multiple sugar transport system substrate-binding protein
MRCGRFFAERFKISVQWAAGKSASALKRVFQGGADSCVASFLLPDFPSFVAEREAIEGLALTITSRDAGAAKKSASKASDSSIQLPFLFRFDALGMRSARRTAPGDATLKRPRHQLRNISEFLLSARREATARLHAARVVERRLHGRQPCHYRQACGDERELLPLLPVAHQSGGEPQCHGHRLLRQPGRADWRALFGTRRAGDLGRRLSRKQQAALRFLEWLVRDDTQQKWADFGGYTADAAILKSAKFRNATPYNEAFFESMFVVKDFWVEPCYAELLDQMNRRLGPFLGSDTVSAKGCPGPPCSRLEGDHRKTRLLGLLLAEPPRAATTTPSIP